MKKGFRAYLPYLIAAAAFVAVCLVVCGTFTAETPKEAARITAKNQMIEECKAYIESLYGKAMPQEVFDANRHYLTETLGEIAKLNRERTPEEKIEQLRRALFQIVDQMNYELGEIRRKENDNGGTNHNRENG